MLSKKESTQSIGQSERESHEGTQKGERETERDTKMERHRELWKLPIENTETGKS